MKPIKFVIVEDSDEFSSALKKVLEERLEFPNEVIVLNPSRTVKPTFEEFHSEIQSNFETSFGLVLMDNQLGEWKWSGAHLAPSFHNIVAISSDPMNWAAYNFTNKCGIAYHNDEKAKVTLMEIVLLALEKSVSPEYFKRLMTVKKATA